jgi:hypothetical protein
MSILEVVDVFVVNKAIVSVTRVPESVLPAWSAELKRP